MSAALRQITNRYHTAYELAKMELDYLVEMRGDVPWWWFKRRSDLAEKIERQQREVHRALFRFHHACWNDN